MRRARRGDRPPPGRLAPRVQTFVLALVTAACVGLAPAPARAQEGEAATVPPGSPTPEQVIERLHAGLLQIMQHADSLGYEGRAKTMASTVAAVYDTEFMARKSVGRHWRSLSAEERARFVDVFGRLTVANYAGRFTGYDGEHFEIEGREDGVHGTVLVKTVLVKSDGEPVHLDYRLHPTDKGWRIIDVYLNGTISELALRRSEYSALLKREGFEKLVEAIDTKIANLRAGGAES